ncbi:hypothetical protein GE061_008299 [Apolygus lucorum]|uniref:THAP-type domain-containing protein n=1 Tax=Apolygus lucorum TaxID=248454 RepID=A0A8S9WQX8_APOLU|nr:hypothetical protein GE061_008299 [Apolygus lucorum]
MSTSSRNCIVYPCRRRGGFRVPLDTEIRLKWLEAIKWPIIPLEPKKTAIVCPTHFTDEDYVGGEDGRKGKRILKDTAVPSIFPWNSDLWSKDEVEKSAALISPSTTDDEKVQSLGVDIESSESSDTESNSGAISEDSAAEIITVSSDDEDDDDTPQPTQREPDKSPETFWESSPACRESIKRSEPSEPGRSQYPGVRKRMKIRQLDIVTTSSSSSSSSDEQESSTNPPSVIVANPKVKPPPSPKTEGDSDSDESDCILCENPIESIDLTLDEPFSPTPGVSSQILFNESDSNDEDISDEALGILESSPPLLLDKSLSLSEDSDCEIIEDNPPLIEIASDEESPENNNYTIIERTNIPKGRQEDEDPFAGVTNGEFDPLTGVPTRPDMIVSSGAPGAASPIPSSSGNVSLVASKNPNAPTIVKNSCSTVPNPYSQRGRERKNPAKKQKEHLISPAEIPRDYEVVDFHPTSKTLRIVLTRKKYKKVECYKVKKPAPDKMEVCVDPLTACLHDDQPERSNRPPKITKSSWTVVRKDLAFEETQLASVILLRNSKGFEPHCESLAKKLGEIIRKSEIMACKLSPETTLSMYRLLFLTEISYGIIYWGHCEGAHRIFELQKRFISLLSDRDAPELKASRATFRKHGVLTLPSLYILHCLIHVHKNFVSVRRRAALRLSEDQVSVKYSKTHNKTYEIQGLEFYLALPQWLQSPNCGLKKFIHIVKRFLRQNGIFNSLEYYDKASGFPKVADSNALVE